MKRISPIMISIAVLLVCAFGTMTANAEECQHLNKHYLDHTYVYDCTVANTQDYICTDCGYQGTVIYREAKPHNIKKNVSPADCNNQTYGFVSQECTDCGMWFGSTSIPYPSTITISKEAYTYTGSAIKPKVTIKDCEDKTISATNYKVTYQNNTKPGKANITITFTGNYTGTVSMSFIIRPKATTISSAKYASKGKMNVKWKKNAQGSGYIVQYSTSSKFAKKNTCNVIVSKNTTLSKAISSLPKKTYYVRVAAYKKIDGQLYRGAWSKSKKVVIKKGVSLKTMINSTKTDLSGRKDILEITHKAVDIKKYNTTYDRIKAIYDWHSKNNTKYFANCMECNMSFNDAISVLYGKKEKYDQHIWLAAGSFKNNNGSVVMHKWSVLYIKGVPYIFDPRLQGYTSNKKGTTYFGVPKSSKLTKKYLFEGWMFYWSYDMYSEIK